MIVIHTVREFGPAAPSLRPDVVDAARAALTTEILAAEAVHTGPPEDVATPRSRRRFQARGLVSAVVVAATVAALAVWGPSMGSVSGPGVPSAAAAVVLSPFTMPDFPVSLTNTPEGMAPPVFDGSPTNYGLFYNSLDPASPDQVALGVVTADTGWPSDPFITTATPIDVAVHGHPGEFAVTDYGVDGGSGTVFLRAAVRWEARPDLWVTVSGSGTYVDQQKLLEVAETVTDRPQPVALELGLAPAGWRLQFFKSGGTVLTLVSDTDPEQTLTLVQPEQPMSADTFRAEVEGVSGDTTKLTVNGQPALLVPTDYGWFLQAATTDGTVFTLQAPSSFTLQQVVDVAAQVEHH